MRLELRFFANFREAVGQKTIHREYDEPTTVGEVLAALESEFEGLDLLDGDDIRSHINVLKNGREVLHLDGVDTTLEAGDKLSVFPPVAGGQNRGGDRRPDAP
jgi:molybdopterin synthase sulfur carrier subunit